MIRHIVDSMLLSPLLQICCSTPQGVTVAIYEYVRVVCILFYDISFDVNVTFVLFYVMFVLFYVIFELCDLIFVLFYVTFLLFL